jgi:glycosyltransferase involved in cell wall biosynthesis
MPEFSVLLPTRNGGPYLRTCINSVLGQRDTDVELVVSDNANTDETAAVLEEFAADDRLRVVRHITVQSVTDNWMSALEASSGDYILTIGDDDYVLPGYFSAVDAALRRHHWPECVAYNGYSYVFPKSMEGAEVSYFADPHFHFDSALAEGPLSAAYRRKVVTDMFRYLVRYPLNVQLTTFSRAAMRRVPAPFFRQPFPDHFAINSLLLTAASFVYIPAQLVVIGLSPKSFGHYAYGGNQAVGMTYLGSTSDFQDRLEGSELHNSMHAWLRLLAETYPDELRGVEIDRSAYVRRQIAFTLLQFRQGAISGAELARRGRRLKAGDWLRLAGVVGDGTAWRRLPRLLEFARRDRARQHWPGLRPLPEVADIGQFAAWASRGAHAGDLARSPAGHS